MSNIKRYLRNLALPALVLALGAVVSFQLPAQSQGPGTTVPETYALPSSVADVTKPGFIFNVSQVAQDTHPNRIANAEKQLAGGFGDNLADPAAVGVASGPAQAPNPSTAPITFEIPTVININRIGGENRGDFANNEQMPGIPGTTGSTANIAGELLTYLDLPVGTNRIGVTSSTSHRLQIGGVTLGDQFGPAVGQLDGDNRRGGRTYNVIITKAGLYPARLVFNNAGDDRTYVQWHSGGPDAKVLINGNGGIKAYRAVTQPTGKAYSRRLIPGNGETRVFPSPQFHAELVDGTSAIDKATVSAQVDGAAVTATVAKAGSVTSADFSSATPLSPGSHTAALVYTEGGSSVIRSWSFLVGNYTTLDPAWRVTPDSTKPGFNWNIFANSDGNNTANTIPRVETDLSLLAVDAAGATLPNLADPSKQGDAIAVAAAANPANAPLHFDIATTINLDAAANMPGSPATDTSVNGQAGEALAYLTLPAGVITMVVVHSAVFSTASGPNPWDAFGRVELALDSASNDATREQTTTFSFLVQQAGTYPFRTIGGANSQLRWYSLKADGTQVLVNDTANGGIPAFRATTTPSVPYVKGSNPLTVPRQFESYSSRVSVVLADGANPIVDASVIFQLDGKAVTTAPVRQGKYLTVTTGEIPGFSAAGEVHTGVITFKDSTGTSRTQQWAIYNLQNLVLPATPVTGENFDSYPESSSPANTVPPGWVATNYTLHETAGWDLTSQNSDAYWNWVIISTDTVQGIEPEVLQNDTTQKINGVAIGDNWMKGNLLFAASDGRAGNGNPQVQIAVTKAFDLSAVNAPVLTFYSGQRITDNLSEADAVEYSVDGGATWLPGAYYHFRTLSLNPDGSYDAVTVLNDPNNSFVPTWIVPGVPGVSGGTFAGGIGAPVSQALAPYIAERTANQPSRRVEAIRLPQASKKSDVRVRFSHVGSCGWEWGIDNIAFYDIPGAVQPPPPAGPTITATRSGTSLTLSWPASDTGFTLESKDSLSSPTWTAVPGVVNNSVTVQIGPGSKFYRLRK